MMSWGVDQEEKCREGSHFCQAERVVVEKLVEASSDEELGALGMNVGSDQGVPPRS